MDLYKQIGAFFPEQLFAGNDIHVLTVGIPLKKNNEEQIELMMMAIVELYEIGL